MSSKLKSIITKNVYEYALFFFALVLTYLTSLFSYLLFHSIAELFSIIISGGIFLIGWNTRKYLKNSFFLVLGISFVFVGVIDLIHTLAYSGMGVFPSPSANLATQLWIAARYLEAASFILALTVIRKKLDANLILVGYILVDAVILFLIFQGLFPTMYIEGFGLTSIKIASEYIIDIILGVSLGILIFLRYEFDKKVFFSLILFLVSTIISELAFTFYVSVFDFSNFIGHIFKIVAFFSVYKAIIETGLESPFQLMFRKLKTSENSLIEQTKYLKQAYSESDQILRASLPLRIVNTDCEIIKVNDTYCNLFGVKTEKIIGEKCYEVFPHNLCHTEECSMKQVRLLKEGVGSEQILEHIDGKSVHLAVKSVPYVDALGNFKGIIQNYTDITYLKEIENKLDQSRSRLNFLVSSSPAVIYTATPIGNHATTFISENVKDLTGFFAKGFVEDKNFWYNHLHPEDKNQIMEDMQPIGEIEYLTLEYRFLFADGRYHWIQDHIKLVKNEQGFPKEVIGYWIDITDKKITEQELKSSEEMFRMTFENASDAIFWADTESGEIVNCNRAAELLTGRSKEEIIGMHQSKIHPPKKVEKYISIFRKHVKEPATYEEAEVIHKSGKITPVVITASLTEIGGKKIIQGIFRDITEQKSIQEKIEDIAKFPAEDPNPVMRVTKNYVLMANKASQEIFNIAEGSKIPQIIKEQTNIAFSKNQNLEFNIEFNKKIYSLFIVPIEGKNYANIYGMDITSREEAKANLERFVSTVSHELRTPISVLVTTLEFIKNHAENITEETRRRLDNNVTKNVYLLRDLVEDILILSKIDEEKIEIEWEEYKPSQIINEILTLMQPIGKQKDIKFLTNMDEDLILRGDPKKVDQMLRIFIDNAVKYSNEGGKIKLNLQEDFKNGKKGGLIQVQDEGIGISNMDLPLIFNRFYRSDQVTDIPGTGLGLSIAKELIKLHEGEFSVESKLGEGSTFSIFLPKNFKKNNNI